jgi:hypothetical protein
MLALKGAPFDTRDPKLVPSAGPCSTCQYRTGTQPELFADVSGADVCTNPPCYHRKVAAHGNELIEKAKAEGRAVIEGKKLFESDGRLRTGAGYVDLSARCDLLGWDSKKTWGQVLAKEAPAPAVAVNPEGVGIEVVRRDEALAIAKRKGLVKPGRYGGGGPPTGEDRKKIILENKIRREASRIKQLAVIEVAQKLDPAEFWRRIVPQIGNGQFNTQLDVELGLAKPGARSWIHPQDPIKTAKALGLLSHKDQVARVIAGATVQRDELLDYQVNEVTDLFGVDGKRLEQIAKENVKAEGKQPPAKAKGKASKRGD